MKKTNKEEIALMAVSAADLLAQVHISGLVTTLKTQEY